MKDYEGYAINLSGVGQMALDGWEAARRLHDDAVERGDDVDAALYSGRCQAFSLVLRLITGRHPGTHAGLVREILASI